MDELMKQIEESNLRWALHSLRQAKSQRRWSIGQGAIFAALGLVYIVFVVTGSSWFYLVSTAIYFAATAFFWKWAWGRWTDSIWRALRQVACARIRLRKLTEEED
jgi:hypothetical protein